MLVLASYSQASSFTSPSARVLGQGSTHDTIVLSTVVYTTEALCKVELLWGGRESQ